MSRILDKTQIEDKTECAGTPAHNQFFVLADQLRKFRKDERGSIIIFSLFIFIMMLMIGGLALDVMRAEYQRTSIQYTADRAVLAATSLKQTVSPQDVIDDYFAKAGIVGFTPVATLEIDEDNLRKVVVEYPDGPPKINTMFMNMVGLHTLDTPAAASAIDGVEKVEISLVLDVSGSMGGSSASGATKLADLKDAAKEFIDTILLEQPEEDTYSISIVPYSTQVTVGESLLDQFNVTNEHDSSHCVDFDSADFQTAGIAVGAELQRTGHFSPVVWGDMDRPPGDWSRACYTDTTREIIPVSGDRTTLKNYIDDFYSDGWTSTEIGIKWGATLLAPETRTIVDDLIDGGNVEAKFSGRPYDYDEEGSLKVIIVMTDGANTNQYLLNDAVKDGMSPVWLKTKTNGDNKYWIYNEDRWQSKKFYKAFYQEDNTSTFGNAQKWVNAPAGNATQLTWQELWAHAPMEFVSHYLFDKADMDYDWHQNDGWDGFYERFTSGGKDVRMNDICTAAKSNNILIFTIGFEVSNSNANKLAACATTAAHFFRVEGVEISEAFSSIAAQLNSLRLTQ